MEIAYYKPRLVDDRVKQLLSTFGAVCIEGPKWCGKTWTAYRHSNSAIMMGDPAGGFQNRRLAEMNPALVLEGEMPRLIDEWQEAPQLWDAVRYRVDMAGRKGCFLLTGSATPVHKGILHSGTGRIARMRMRPMSLFESGDSRGQASLRNLFSGTQRALFTGDVSLQYLIRLTLRGGWPASIDVPSDSAFELSRSYIDTVIKDDVYREGGVRHDTRKMELLLRSLARNEATTATNKKLLDDVKGYDSQDIDRDTVAQYLDVFRRLFLLDEIEPFSPHLRSSTRLKQAVKRHFVDPSLACALLDATESTLLGDLNTYGFLFESMCERDLRIYAESLGGTLSHYQDYNNKEIDAVVTLPDGSWGAFEIKLGINQVDVAAEGLLRMKTSFEDNGDTPPALLAVVCGLSNAVFQRPDGVYVLPITALKP